MSRTTNQGEAPMTSTSTNDMASPSSQATFERSDGDTTPPSLQASSDRGELREVAEPRAEKPNNLLMLAVSWLGVGLPLAWGVAQTLKKALMLFG